ncbi:MAG: hypothetical protein JW797_05620 [Bradymonadales bacterium]|nr:hypothetical protein [Bradymonadales bacterium]
MNNKNLRWLVVLGLLHFACGDTDTPIVDAGPDLTDVISDAFDVVQEPVEEIQPDLVPDVPPDTPPDLGPAGVPVADCDPDHVLRFAAGDRSFIAVYPHDWSLEEGSTYSWYDPAELTEWILIGTSESLDFAAVLTELEFPVVGTDGLPHVAANPPLFPYRFGQGYYSPTLDRWLFRATEVYSLADLGEDLDPDSIANELVDGAGNGLSGEDREIYDLLLLRFERWNAVHGALQALVETHFGYDSDNLQCAFDNVLPTERVQLVHEEGQFYLLNQAILAEDFTGMFAGQGVGQTAIKTVAGGFTHGPEPFFEEWPWIFIFVGGDYLIRDFDLVVEGSTLWGLHHDFNDALGGFFVTGRHNGLDDGDASQASANLKNVRFLGRTGPEFSIGTNLLWPVLVHGEFLKQTDRFNGSLLSGRGKPFGGVFVMNGCSVSDAFLLGGFWNLTDAQLTLVGNRADSPLPAPLFWLAECNGGTYTIRENETQQAGGVYFEEGVAAVFGWDLGPIGTAPEASCRLFIENNSFGSSNSGWAPVELHSYVHLLDSPRVSSTARIRENTIHSEDQLGPSWIPDADFLFEGVFADGVDNGQITQNTFVGTGMAAVNIGLFDTQDTHWLIEDNHFGGYSASTADIYLGPSTANITVIGAVGETTTLKDLGTQNSATNVTLVE